MSALIRTNRAACASILGMAAFSFPAVAHASTTIDFFGAFAFQFNTGSWPATDLVAGVVRLLLGVMFFVFMSHLIHGHYVVKLQGGNYERREIGTKMKSEGWWGLAFVVVASLVVSPVTNALAAYAPQLGL